MERLTKLLKLLNSFALLALLSILTLATLHVYRTTLPRVDQEVTEVQRASVEAGLSAMETRKLLKAENKALPETQAKIDTLIDRASTLLTTSNVLVAHIDSSQALITKGTLSTMQSVTDSVATLPGAINEARTAIVGLEPLESQSTELVASLQKAVPGVVATSNNVAGMTDSGNKILADGAYETHKLTHPGKRGFWGTVVFVLEQFKPALF